jgi:hypothetical protein
MGTDGTLTASVLGSSTGTVRTLPSCVRARACCHAACARNRVSRQQNSRRAAAGAASETVASLRQPACIMRRGMHRERAASMLARLAVAHAAGAARWRRHQPRPRTSAGASTAAHRAAHRNGRRPASCSCRSARVPSAAAEHDEHGHHGARDVATNGCAAHLRRVCTQPKALSRSDAMAARAGSMLAWVVLFTVHAKFVTRGLLRWQAFGEAWQQASAAAQRHWRPGQSSGVMGPPSHVPPTVGEVQRSRPR